MPFEEYHIFPAVSSNLHTGAAQKRAIVRTDFPEPLGWRLEECLRKDGGHLEDVVFKK
jgi:hypothetical protein